ncbi:MAG: hypothetical protein KKG76_10560 [Euryarchaeota archaeon]|nr:hypothetical protein [Euryarchaeota archaeon]MBU4139052.1 hypothetical protein [Euryarchaeota archaeon]
MPVIRNKLNQRIIINLKSGKNIDLFAKSTADVSDQDLSSSHLQTQIAKGEIVVMEGVAEKTESRKIIRKGR